VNMQISQIATAAEEQTATTMEISGNIQQVNDIALKAKEHIQQTSLASNTMLTMSEDLMAILGKFKLNEDLPMVLNRAKCAHMLFVGKIKSHLLGYKTVDPTALPTHLTCAFGKWYQDKGKESCGHSTLFREIDGPHARVHELGKQAIMAFTAGDRERAMALCEEMTGNSTALIEILDRLAREC
ncbi:MAG TPA: CZB domain-containing protein, partial [Geobacteraceae bacterium]